MQIYRLLEIVYILLEKKAVTAKKLSQRFDVSQRTIYRDIDILSAAGIPVYTEKGKGGGISLLPEFILDKSLISEQEQNEILSALQAFSGMKAAKTDRALKKVSAIFNKSSANWLQVDFSPWSVAANDFFSDLKTAILERRIVEFDYYSAYYEKTRRRVEPVQLWFKSKAWYLKGFCLKQQDMRLFKLTRLKNLMVTDKHFNGREMLEDHTETAAGKQQNHSVFIKLKIEAEMTYRVFDEFDENMVEKQQDGSLIVSAAWPQDDWVYGFVLSFGEYIEVLEPEHIRETIRKKLIKMQKKYL
ncbi:MAG: YafY family transcriptional regulator [Treponema sp.]|jgi:predicted DNA-binding transcriptional regulator YafY|nr:YafY family transcriptional regulator [Treponema sp.]